MKTLLVLRPVECPNCGKVLTNGGVMYQDGDKVTCGYCKNNKQEDEKK